MAALRGTAGESSFLDIETTGLYAGPNAITMTGLFDGLETRVFIQGINLDEFILDIQKYPQQLRDSWESADRESSGRSMASWRCSSGGSIKRVIKRP